VLDPQGANDQTKLYLIVWTSHDGSVAVQAAITPVRVVCQNTLNLAMRNAKQSFKIRHTQSAEGKIVIAREALGLANKFMDKFDEEMADLISREINEAKFLEIVTALYPKPDKDSKGSMTKWENKVALIQDIYTGPTNNMIAGTAWGALNAMTERLDWYRAARGGNTESMAAAASGFDVATNSEKARILSAVRELTAA